MAQSFTYLGYQSDADEGSKGDLQKDRECY